MLHYVLHVDQASLHTALRVCFLSDSSITALHSTPQLTSSAIYSALLVDAMRYQHNTWRRALPCEQAVVSHYRSFTTVLKLALEADDSTLLKH